jgi:hypothetical protein
MYFMLTVLLERFVLILEQFPVVGFAINLPSYLLN